GPARGRPGGGSPGGSGALGRVGVGGGGAGGGPGGDLRGQRGVEPRGQRGGHGRRGGAGQGGGHGGGVRSDLGAARAFGQVGGDPGGPAGGQQILAERGDGLIVGMTSHWLSPPPSAGETSLAALWFRAAGPVGGAGPTLAACAAAGDPRRWPSRGRRRARPREQRLLIVPSEVPRIS